MPKTKSYVSRLAKRLKEIKNFRPQKRNYFILLIITILISLVIFKKNLIIVATVNGEPITSIELLSQMNKQFRSQTLNQIIQEKIILQEARKNNISASENEANDKIVEIEAQVGNAQNLDSLLQQQGQSRYTLREQIKKQLIIQKLYSEDVSITPEELEQFLVQYKANLTATDSASQKSEAEEILKQQKLSQIISQKLQELQQNSKVSIY